MGFWEDDPLRIEPYGEKKPEDPTASLIGSLAIAPFSKRSPWSKVDMEGSDAYNRPNLFQAFALRGGAWPSSRQPMFVRLALTVLPSGWVGVRTVVSGTPFSRSLLRRRPQAARNGWTSSSLRPPSSSRTSLQRTPRESALDGRRWTGSWGAGSWMGQWSSWGETQG